MNISDITPLEWAGMGAAVFYICALILLGLYAIHTVHLLLTFLRHRKAALKQEQAEDAQPLPAELPHVLVQVPVYNERDVVQRCVEAVGALRWPADRLTIQLLDDGNDDSIELGGAAIQRLQEQGVDAHHVQREDRVGYKAGALEYGMTLCPQAEYIAIFDADFIPNADFLEKAIKPFFADEKLALVQGRWEHCNPEANVLTRAQAIGIDGHFAVEQGARAWGGLAMNFNGTAGLWKRQAIEEAGGWEHDTLTEDLDLSYRVQLCGWRCTYRLGLAVPAELPADIHAWRAQQFRWAKGSQQSTRKLMGRVWRSDWSLEKRLAALFHMSHYAVHPLMVTSLLSAPLALWLSPPLPIWMIVLGSILFVLGMGAPIATYAVSQKVLGRKMWRFWRRAPQLAALGTGIALSNSVAVREAWSGIESPFIRTPKQGSGQGSYKARSQSGFLECVAGLWAVTGVLLAFEAGRPWAVPLLAIYTSGFFIAGAMMLRATWRSEPIQWAGWSWRLLVAAILGAIGYSGMAWPSGGWQQQPVWFAGFGLLAGCAFMLAVWESTRLARQNIRLGGLGYVTIFAAAILFRVLALGLEPSDDVNRYVLEGVQVTQGENPYVVAPDQTQYRYWVSDEIVEGVNHPSWTAIYPPLTLMAQASMAGIAPTVDMQRALMLMAELIGAAFVLATLSVLRQPLHRAVVWLWNPIILIWLVGEAHNDALMIAALAAMGWLLAQKREALGITALSVAALCKPFAAVALLPSLLQKSVWRWLLPIGIAVLAYAPFMDAGWNVFASFGRFGTEKSFNGVLEPFVRMLYSQVLPYESVRQATVGTLIVLLIAGAGLIVWRARAGVSQIGGSDPIALQGKLLLWLICCLPTFHPWYFAMIIPFMPIASLPAVVVWCGLMPLHALHGLAMENGTRWAEIPMVTMLIHGPPLFLLILVIWRRSRPWRLPGLAISTTERGVS